jgi:assimilatory nitrate reductase catalytic subunit
VEAKRFFAGGNFFTPDRKARFIAPEMPALREAASGEFPYRLNTGRVRDQWHSMTRTGKSPRLAAHMAEPYVEVHPSDAKAANLIDGGFATVTTSYGACILKVIVSDGQRPGSLFAPIHWSDETASSARVGSLVTARCDPASGQPEMKATPAAIAPIDLPLRGFIHSRRELTLPPDTWWTKISTNEGMELRIATDRGLLFWADFAERTLGQDAQLVELTDATQGTYRTVAFIDGEFDGCLSVGSGDVALRWDSLKALVAAGAPKGEWPVPLQATVDVEDEAGPTICACLGIGENTIREAVRCGAATVTAIGNMTGAGKSCGSCLPELKRLAARERLALAGGMPPG